MPTPSNSTRSLLVAAVIILVAALAYGFLTMPDRRTGSEKLGDAISELPDTTKATRELEDRTPGQKIGDAVKDAGDDLGETIKENTKESGPAQ